MITSDQGVIIVEKSNSNFGSNSSQITSATNDRSDHHDHHRDQSSQTPPSWLAGSRETDI